MIKGVHHVAVSTPDLQRLCRFYCDVLGFEKIREGGWERGSAAAAAAGRVVGIEDSAAKVAIVRKAGFIVEIFEYSVPAPNPRSPEWRVSDYGYTHICLEVEDIDLELQRVSRGGMTFQDRRAGEVRPGHRAIYGRDPDGNVIELYEISMDKDQRACVPK